MSSLDIFMLGFLSDQSNVADYGLALRLVSISSVILIITNGLVGPHYSNLWKKNRIVELKEHFTQLCIFMAGLALVILVTFFVFGELMLELLYGQKYVEIFSLLNILSLGQAVVLATGPVAFMLMMSDSKEKHKVSLLIALLLNITLNIMLIPSYGAIGAAIATAVSLVCKNIYSFYSVYKKFFSDKMLGKYE
jgi:O-antigen/teichoic acid export membrane protein